MESEQYTIIKRLPVVLHIGYHKTATTYLQKLIFPQLTDVLYLGRAWKSAEIHSYFLDNQFTHSLQFDSSAMRERFYSAISKWTETSGIHVQDKKAILVSHESIHSGPEWFGAEFTLMADRMKATLPNAKIIIGIRKQVDYIESNYRTYIMHGGKLGFKKFLSKSYAHNYSLLPKLYFDQAIKYYMNKFGKENVYVYLLEDFKRDLKSELDKILSFAGATTLGIYRKDQVNVGLNKYSIGLLRQLNKLIASDFNEQYYNWMNQKLNAKEKFRWRIVRALNKFEEIGLISLNKKLCSPEEKKQLNEMFLKSNKNLSLLLGKDLSALGYYQQ
ncbi:hypothetical protein BH11BAC1_BH11BAC1_11900 [soil metagenome]